MVSSSRNATRQVRVIGLTGGIGSGKSVVSRVLRLNGHPVYDCDYEARRLMEDSRGELYRQLSRRFGEDLYREDGSLDRSLLAARIFTDAEARMFVNMLVHARVRTDFMEWCDFQREHGHGTVYVESAILASGGLADLCDEVILVEASEEERVIRAMGRGMKPEDARARVRSQLQEPETLRTTGVPFRIIDNGEEGESLLQFIIHN